MKNRATFMDNIRDLYPVKAMHGGNVLNKAGRLVMRGTFGGDHVKIFEASNLEHSLFIERVIAHESLSNIFPGLRGRCGRFLVSDWIAGQSIDDMPGREPKQILIDTLLFIQKMFHDISAAALPRPGFDYWHDLIFPRFERAADFFGATRLLEDVLECVNKVWDGPGKILMHPDLTPTNVVFSKIEGVRVVDNELITIGGMPLFDVCNTAYSLGEAFGQIYFNRYLETRRYNVNVDDLSALQAAWLARRVGSAFVAGELGGARACIDDYLNGLNVLPVNPAGMCF